MAKLMPLAVIAVAVLGACSSNPPARTQPVSGNVVANVHPYRAGTGVVQAVMPVPAAAGVGASASAEPMQRLEIKMDNGTIQYVDTSSREFTRGTRVQLTEDKLIKKM